MFQITSEYNMIKNVLIHRIPNIIDSEKFEKYKSDNFDELYQLYIKLKLEKHNDEHNLINAGNMSAFVDRTRTLPHYLKMAEPIPFPELKTDFNKSFEQVTLERAKEIVDFANGQQICVSWSGGIDSTAVIFALLQYADPKQLMICMNYYSIIESGSLFDKFIKGKGIPYKLQTPVKDPEFDEGVIVTGYLGDQLYGKIQSLSEEHFTMNWRNLFDNEQIEVFERILENYPQKNVNTVPQFQSFIEMNTKWEMGRFNRMRGIPKSISDRMINFYETDDYQRWSIGDYEQKYGSTADPKKLKLPHRKFLEKYMGTDFYSSNKVIQTSHYHILDHNWVMLLEDGTNLYLKDF